ncbi:MAG: helix-turn-helix transcriptional regulator [Dissulfurispiraceae bacterium]|jgi:predicted transcriptional regulator
MRCVNDHFKEKKQNPKFRENYEYNKTLTDIAVKIAMEREKLALSQAALARMAGITQQQLSRIENAFDCQISTLSKVFKALGISLEFTKHKKTANNLSCSRSLSL